MRSSNIYAGWSVLGVVSLVALAGCGGSTFNGGGGGDGGSNSDAPTSDGGGGGGDGGGGGVSCPTNVPAGGTCPQVGLRCEYGNSGNVACDVLVVCTASGWSPVTQPAPPPECAGTCPASYAQVPNGQACTPDRLECDYPEGTCLCTGSSGGPVQIDAGIDWKCQPAVQGCPSPRPRIGSACTPEGQGCDYGACKGGVSLKCINGAWTEQPQGPCPV